MSNAEAGRRGGWLTIALAIVAGIAVGVAGMLVFRSTLSEERVGQIAGNYIVENPEILRRASRELQRRDTAAAIDPQRAQYEQPYAGAWAGAEDGDVVLVEFFDYACGFCRQSNEAIDRLLAEDPKLKVVWRELPVLGPDSQAAAQASLAAAEQGKFRPFYQALFAAGRPTAEAVEAAMARAGVQRAEPTPAQQAEIARNVQLAQQIQATGTPTFVVGDQVIQGYVPYEELKQAIAEAREQGAS